MLKKNGWPDGAAPDDDDAMSYLGAGTGTVREGDSTQVLSAQGQPPCHRSYLINDFTLCRFKAPY